jgi:hypothetical protein
VSVELIKASKDLAAEIMASGYIGATVGAEVGKPDGGLVVCHQHECQPLVGDEYKGFSVRCVHVGRIRPAAGGPGGG